MDSLSSSGFCHSCKIDKQTQPSDFSLRVAEVFCTGNFRSHFWMWCACSKDRNMQICFWKCFAHARQTWNRRSFFKIFQREHRIHEAARWIDLQNQGTICKNVSCVRENMAESISCTPAKLSLAKRRHFQTLKKAYHKKWPFVTTDEKDDTCVKFKICSSIVKWLDWWTVEHDQQTVFSATQNW